MKNQKVGIIIQARMGSTRLPGKILKTLNKYDRVLDILIKRLKLSKYANEIIIATTSDIKDAAIIEVAKEHQVLYFIGSEENVLKRYYEAAKRFNLDIIVRATSDNPFVDPKILDDMIIFYKDNNYDYITNSHANTNFAIGFDIEIFNFKTLEKLFFSAETQSDKEHVTYYIETHPELFNTSYYDIENLKKFKDLRLTIDEIDDLKLCRTVIEKIMNKGKSLSFSMFDILDIIEENPELMEINKHVRQKII